MTDDNKKIEGTEKKPKSLIDKIWWIIPPVFTVFIYWPLLGFLTSGMPMSFDSVRFYYSMSFTSVRLLFIGEYGWIIPLFLFGFMGIGFIIAKKMSLKYKILIPSILGAIGLYVGAVASLFYYQDPF